MQPNVLRLWTIVKISFRCFFNVGAQFLPRLALSEDIFREAFGRVSALSFLRNLKDQLADMDRIQHGVLKKNLSIGVCCLQRSSLGGLAGSDSSVELGGFFAWDGECRPLAGLRGKMLGQESDLADVVGVMRYLAIDGLHHGMRLRANIDGASQIGFA